MDFCFKEVVPALIPVPTYRLLMMSFLALDFNLGLVRSREF